MNRKDAEGNNVFQGGFLGLDNIGVFDRSAPLPTGGQLEQADGTSWMAMYCLNMLASRWNWPTTTRPTRTWPPSSSSTSSTSRAAVNRAGDDGPGLWSEAQGFYFDLLKMPDGHQCRIDAFTIAGLIPLFAISVGDPESFGVSANSANASPGLRRTGRSCLATSPT